MQPALKTRLLGAFVIIAIAVIVVPLFFSGKPGGGSGSQNISLDIPQTPDQALKTRTLSVASSPQSSTSAPASASTSASGSNGRLATVDIPSRVPPDVHPEQSAPQETAAPASAPTQANASAAGQEVAATPSAGNQASAEKAKTASTSQEASPASNPGKAAVASYRIDLGAYASKSNAERLVAKVRKMGYPVQLNGVRINGKPAARVDVGPFHSRAAAERTRLKLRAALPHAPAKLISAPTTQHGNAPAKALPKGSAGGWAVQVVAYSKRADADKLRDRLRQAGFDSYVDDVKSGGQTLWRVRVGPQTQRADAVSAQERIQAKFPRLKGVVVTVP